MPTSAALPSRAAYPCSPAILARQPAWPVGRPWAGDGGEPAFEARRGLAAHRGRSPLQRVAALLVAISHNNGYEGRDPRAIPDSLTSGFVADLLGLRLSILTSALAELRDQGLIVAAPQSGLRLVDLTGLETLAEAA